MHIALWTSPRGYRHVHIATWISPLGSGPHGHRHMDINTCTSPRGTLTSSSPVSSTPISQEDITVDFGSSGDVAIEISTSRSYLRCGTGFTVPPQMTLTHGGQQTKLGSRSTSKRYRLRIHYGLPWPPVLQIQVLLKSLFYLILTNSYANFVKCSGN